MDMNEWNDNTGEHRVQMVSGGFPWRRWFARQIDMGIYALLWWGVAFLGLNRNVIDWNVRNVIIPFIFMIIIEPLLLRIFGTTPGKALLGIHIRDEAGNKPSCFTGLMRMWRVFVYGYGLMIPFYNLYRNYKSYKSCKANERMRWDEAEDLIVTLRDKKPVRVVLVPICYALTIYLMVCVVFMAIMPRHRGDITTAQFHNNVQRLAEFRGMTPPRGQPQFGPRQPLVDITETDGVVTEISFEIIDGDLNMWWGIRDWIHVYVVSFVGAQRGANIWNMYIRHDSTMVELSPMFTYGETYVNIAYGIEVIRRIELSGANTSFWRADATINVQFTMRRI